jgi:hypothetical protein
LLSQTEWKLQGEMRTGDGGFRTPAGTRLCLKSASLVNKKL